jgi:hypothetical protein
MARVLCCYTSRDPAGDGKFHLHSSRTAALASVRRHAPQASLTDVTGDDFAYWREIRARWTGEQDLVTIEHDIVIGPGTVASLEECDRDWCAWAYDIFGCKRLINALGCTKFSAALQRAVPLDRVAALFSHCAHCHGEGCWWHLDNYLAAALQAAGFAPHVHGDVPHLHDYGAPGAIPLCEGIMSVFSWEAGQEPVQFHVAVTAPERVS